MSIVSPRVTIPQGGVKIPQGPVKLWTTDEEVAAYKADPAGYLLKRCQSIMQNVKMDTNHIMVATFFLPDSTEMRGPDGKPVTFYLPDKTKDEATWQGRCGLLIAKGPMAWVDDEKVKFHGCTHDIGEWLLYDRQDGRQISIGRVHCRRLQDVDVWGKTDDPMSVY